MDVLKRLLNVITVCWGLWICYFFFWAYKKYLDALPLELPAGAICIQNCEEVQTVEYNCPFDILVFILGIGVAILAFNYIFFKKPTLWHKAS